MYMVIDMGAKTYADGDEVDGFPWPTGVYVFGSREAMEKFMDGRYFDEADGYPSRWYCRIYPDDVYYQGDAGEELF